MRVAQGHAIVGGDLESRSILHRPLTLSSNLTSASLALCKMLDHAITAQGYVNSHALIPIICGHKLVDRLLQGLALLDNAVLHLAA